MVKKVGGGSIVIYIWYMDNGSIALFVLDAHAHIHWWKPKTITLNNQHHKG